jgi:hypothetical protein
MTFVIKAAEPIDNRLLIALGGPQASGKTTSALRLATGITRFTGGKIAIGDTEAKRALRYAKDFKFFHVPFDPPFSPARYLEIIQFFIAQGYGPGDVVILDSMSHEHEGTGGVLEMHEKFLEDKCGSDYGKREKLKFTAWIKPKAERTKAIVMGVQRAPFHLILCFRAKEKITMVKNNGKTEVVSAGLQPIGGDEYFFEMDITMILPEGSAGKPDWTEKASRINEIGEGPLKKLLKSTEQISEETGIALARLSTVSDKVAPVPVSKPAEETPEQKTKRMAGDIVRALQKAKEPGDIDSVLHDYREDIEAVKAASQAAYDYVMTEKGVRMKAMGVA